MTWKIKAKGAKQTTEVISDDPKYAIFKADQWRSHGLSQAIEHDTIQEKSSPPLSGSVSHTPPRKKARRAASRKLAEQSSSVPLIRSRPLLMDRYVPGYVPKKPDTEKWKGYAPKIEAQPGGICVFTCATEPDSSA
jgi:hypothetical protein